MTNSNQFQKLLLPTVIALLLIVIIVGGALYFINSQSKDGGRLSVITINDSEKMKVKNDKATITVYIEDRGVAEEVDKLSQENDRVTADILNYLKTQAITSEDILTNKNIYDYYPWGPVPDIANPTLKNQKTVATSVAITFNRVDQDSQKPATILSELTLRGVDRFDGFRYELSDRRSVCRELEDKLFTGLIDKGQDRVKAIGGRVVKTEFQTENNNCDQIFSYFDRAVGPAVMPPGSSGELTTTTPPVLSGVQEVNLSGSLRVYYSDRSWLL